LTHSDQTERVVLLDDAGRAVGTAPKADVHHSDTPLHLAFSCYVFDASRRLLVTRRAVTKRVFPGVWTNSVCGHPAPGEPLGDAAERRARAELGLIISEPRLLLPRFAYTAEMNGIAENELCPVYWARATTPWHSAWDPSEVEEVRWVPWVQFRDEVLAGAREVSPWCRLQVAGLAGLGDDPLSWAEVSDADLPPAAQEWAWGEAS
jgi:isopentenyl-diphosphate Delta-isomerase